MSGTIHQHKSMSLSFSLSLCRMKLRDANGLLCYAHCLCSIISSSKLRVSSITMKFTMGSSLSLPPTVMSLSFSLIMTWFALRMQKLMFATRQFLVIASLYCHFPFASLSFSLIYPFCMSSNPSSGCRICRDYSVTCECTLHYCWTQLLPHHHQRHRQPVSFLMS